MTPRVLRTALVLAGALLACAAPAAGAPIRTGFSESEGFTKIAPGDRGVAFAHMRAGRASVVRVDVAWPLVAPAPPPSAAAARDPQWSGYSWEGTDAIIRGAAAAGLRVLVSVTGAPGWAEGPGRPVISPAAPAGTWKPSPAAYRLFAEAAARRYGGSTPDPAVPGGALPRVRFWQAWNEPNLSRYISPQWARSGGRLRPFSPGHYRRLLNAFYAGVKSVSGGNFVVSAGTAPFGESTPSGSRIRPVRFVRGLLCLRGRRLRRGRCGRAARLDALAHHPYSLGGPRRSAINDDDVSIPDLGALTRPLRVAVRRGTVRPRRRKQLWVTEFSWDSAPPDPFGVPVHKHARWLEGSLFEFWRRGVDVAIWFGLRDQPRGRGYQFGNQSGVFYRGTTVGDDVPKPAYTAFRFPFTAYRIRGRTELWGIAPSRGFVSVERRGGGVWRRVATLRARGGRVFHRRTRLGRGSVLRARQGAETSLSWRVR